MSIAIKEKVMNPLQADGRSASLDTSGQGILVKLTKMHGRML